MPNWCWTQYNFHGNEEDISKLKNLLDICTSKEYIDTGFGKEWLGNVLYEIGEGDKINNDHNDLEHRCRGRLYYNNDYDINTPTLLMLETETAWDVMPEMWDLVIRKLNLESVTYSYHAEEPGNEYYVKHNAPGFNDFTDEVYIDALGESIYLKYISDRLRSQGKRVYKKDVILDEKLSELSDTPYLTRVEAVKALNKFFDTDYNDISDFTELIRKFNKRQQRRYDKKTHFPYRFLFVNKIKEV